MVTIEEILNNIPLSFAVEALSGTYDRAKKQQPTSKLEIALTFGDAVVGMHQSPCITLVSMLSNHFWDVVVQAISDTAIEKVVELVPVYKALQDVSSRDSELDNPDSFLVPSMLSSICKMWLNQAIDMYHVAHPTVELDDDDEDAPIELDEEGIFRILEDPNLQSSLAFIESRWWQEAHQAVRDIMEDFMYEIQTVVEDAVQRNLSAREEDAIQKWITTERCMAPVLVSPDSI